MSIVIPEKSRSPHPRARATTEPTKLNPKGSSLVPTLITALWIQSVATSTIVIAVWVVTR